MQDTQTTHHASLQKKRPFNIAVIGSGAAGFFLTEAILAKTERTTVDLFDQAPSLNVCLRALGGQCNIFYNQSVSYELID